jgi:purine-binding chemotaxis protein CheW
MTPTMATPIASVPRAASESAGVQYLTFICANEEYGVEILRVQEIRGWSAVTRLPEAPRDVMGVMNLRGAMVPLPAMAAKLGDALRSQRRVYSAAAR